MEQLTESIETKPEKAKKSKSTEKTNKEIHKKVQMLDNVTEQNFNKAMDSVNQDLNPDDTLGDLSSEPDTDCEPAEHLPPIKSKMYDKNTF